MSEVRKRTTTTTSCCCYYYCGNYDNYDYDDYYYCYDDDYYYDGYYYCYYYYYDDDDHYYRSSSSLVLIPLFMAMQTVLITTCQHVDNSTQASTKTRALLGSLFWFYFSRTLRLQFGFTVEALGSRSSRNSSSSRRR